MIVDKLHIIEHYTGLKNHGTGKTVRQMEKEIVDYIRHTQLLSRRQAIADCLQILNQSDYFFKDADEAISAFDERESDMFALLQEINKQIEDVEKDGWLSL